MSMRESARFKSFQKLKDCETLCPFYASEKNNLKIEKMSKKNCKGL